jgi:L-alanine-DL-glutamate epimerase-like enolase superfamily enzyme
MEIKIHTFLLKLNHTFTLSRESRDEQPTLIVEFISKGISGFGEATASSYYNISIHDIKKDILNAASSIKKNSLTNYTIGIDSVEKMILKMKEVSWPIYKIKLGTKDDIKIITELRKHTNAIFRVDANCGWKVDEAIENSKKLKELNVEFIEQPLKANDFEGAKKLFQKSFLPIIADESCITETDIEKCHLHFHGVNIKLTKCGGFTPARRMITKAKSFGMKTMVHCY